MKPAQENRYVLGFPEMDEQHKYLYFLFDRIENSSVVTDQATMKELLGEIDGYLLFHFTSEEHLMRLYNVPGFAGHQSDHEAMAARLIKFMDDFETGRLNPAALKIFLTGWLMEHSEFLDREYVSYIKKIRESSRWFRPEHKNESDSPA